MARPKPEELVDIVVDDMPPLTPKQKRFCEEYIIDCNASAAARRAGYQRATGATGKFALLNKPQVAAYIDQLQANLSAENAKRTRRVVDMLYETAMDDQCNMQYRLRAAELYGKHVGLFTERIQQDTRIEIVLSNELKELGE